MLRHRRTAFGAVLGVAVLAFAGATMAATTTVVVTPANHQGWVLNTVVLGNGPVATDFSGPGDSDDGNGSFHFGPIAGSGAEKLEIQPPEVGQLVADFDSLAFEYDVMNPPASGGVSSHVYVNIYVDSAANGIGFFGSGITSTGFYDCRYLFTATTNNPGWNTLEFVATDAPAGLTSRHSSCAATLAGFTDLSQIEFFRLNGGGTGTSDNGLEAAYDLVAIEFNGNATVYDFEPYAVASSKDQCKDGGWQNVFRDDGSAFKNQGNCIQYVNTGK
jgi:hypothetical protein